MPDGTVVAVSRSGGHTFSKSTVESITLVAGLGVEGDAHSGAAVRHRSRVARDPSRPNLRQVHLIHAELFDEVRSRGFEVGAGQLGENITTSGLDLLALPTGTCLRIGESALLGVTGLRNPCRQINDFQSGLLAQVLGRDEEGRTLRRAGIMSVVLEGGIVRPGDPITIALPPEPHHPLLPV